MEDFFPPNSSEEQRSDADQSQMIAGDAHVDHTQFIGGDAVKLLGGYIPPIPPGFRLFFGVICLNMKYSLYNVNVFEIVVQCCKC